MFLQVKLLKDILEAWKAEVEKKPPTMSLDEAYETLNLPKGVGGHEEAKIRKAYFKLAQKYHPDKNPDGRVGSMFSHLSIFNNTTQILKKFFSFPSNCLSPFSCHKLWRGICVLWWLH